MSKAAQRLGALVAEDLDLELVEFTSTLSYIAGFPEKIKGFVFAFEEQGVVHYDLVDAWSSVNGHRLRIPRFKSCPLVEQRLQQKKYRRWFVRGSRSLFPIHASKVAELKDLFPFITDDNPGHQTSTIWTEPTQWLRKKPLVASRVHRETWSK